MTSGQAAAAAPEALPRATQGRVLLVDDEPRILDFVSRGLRSEGYSVDLAADGNSALAAVAASPYDLIVLDLLMPGTDGVTVLRRVLDRNPRQAVIVLSCLSDSASKVNCLELGAQDYMAKPFSLSELLARVRLRMRSSTLNPATLRVKNLSLDLLRRQADAGSGPVTLAEREFLLLLEFMRNAGRTLSKEELLADVWGYRFDADSNVVDVYVRRLRAKLGDQVIRTIRGEGYRVDD